MIEEVIIAALWYVLTGYFSVASANKIQNKRPRWWGQGFSLSESTEGAHFVITYHSQVPPPSSHLFIFRPGFFSLLSILQEATTGFELNIMISFLFILKLCSGSGCTSWLVRLSETSSAPLQHASKCSLTQTKPKTFYSDLSCEYCSPNIDKQYLHCFSNIISFKSWEIWILRNILVF